MHHPAQSNPDLLDKLQRAFQASMEKRGLIPKNPWKAKRVDAWLAKMGARMRPGSDWFRPEKPDCKNYVNFNVDCIQSKMKIKGRRGWRFMRIEIPWDLADKILTLGFLP
jgi:hypothetical protein